MNVLQITKPNIKGQIVIPKGIRDTLDIDENVSLNISVRDGGIFIYPIEEVLVKAEKEPSYLKILQMTKGAWGQKDLPSHQEKRKLELDASRRRKIQW